MYSLLLIQAPSSVISCAYPHIELTPVSLGKLRLAKYYVLQEKILIFIYQ